MTTRRLLASASAATILPALFAIAFFMNGTSAEAQVPATRTFGNAGWDAVYFFFIEKGIKPYVDGVAIDDDALTTQKICQLAGYSRVQFLRSKNFASCGDNFIEYWNGSSWIRSAACSRQPFIDTLTCADPIASSSSSSSSTSVSSSSSSSSSASSIPPFFGSSSSSVAGGFSAIDVKINGQDGTVNAAVGSTVTISWTSSGVQRCDTDGSQSPWGPNRVVPTSGSESVVVTKSMTFSIQCAQTTTSPMIVMDVVGVNATGSISSSSNSSFSTSFPSSSSSSFSTSFPSSSTSSISSFSSSNSSVSSGTSSFSSMAPGMGCIQIYKQAYDMNGNEFPVTPQFTFTLDGSQTTFNGAYGRARFDNVAPGTHAVTEIVPNGWSQLLVTPENGVVNVAAGRCSGIVFINRQMFVAGSSSSSASSVSSSSNSSSLSSSSSSVSSSSSSPSSASSVSSSVSSSTSSVSSISSSVSSSVSSSSSSSSLVSSVSSSGSSVSSSPSSISSSSLSSSSSSVSSSSSASSINLTIAKTDNRTTVNQNDRVTYTISISNATLTTANNVTVTDDLPPQVTFVSASNGGTLSSSRVTWTNLTVPANSTLFITVTVDVNANATGTLTNIATVNGGNSATDSTTVNAPPQTFLQLTKFASYQQVNSSRTIDYTVTVRNAGSNNALNVLVTDNTDSDTTITSNGGGTQNGNQLQWNAGTLMPNETRTFQYRVSVNSGVPSGTVISNTVRTSGSNATEVQVTLNLTLVGAGNNVQFAQSKQSPTSLMANASESSIQSFIHSLLKFLSPFSVLQAIAATI